MILYVPLDFLLNILMPIKNKGQVEVHSEKIDGKIIETTNFDNN